jgi:multiple sugar transport system permease protein
MTAVAKITGALAAGVMVPARRRGARSDRSFITLMLAPSLLILAAFYLYPMASSTWFSLTDLSLMKLRQGGRYIGLENYSDALTGADFWRVVWNTAFWLTAVSVAVRLVLGMALALLLHSQALLRLRLRTVMRLALLVPWATPPIVAVAVWRWLLNPQAGGINRALLWLGVIRHPVAFLADTATVWPSIVLIMLWNTLPVATLTLLAALQSVPRELGEAAALDGAGSVLTFRHVTLPHIMPTIMILAMLMTFWSFNNFVYVWLATGGGPGRYTDVLATEVYLRGFVDFNLGSSAAIGVIMAAAMATFGLLYLRLLGRRVSS